MLQSLFPRPSIWLGLPVLLVALVTTGCQPGSYSSRPIGSDSSTGELIPLDQLDWLENPRAYEGPSTARSTTVSLESLPLPAPAPQLPSTVISNDLDGDVPMTVEEADRIIAVDLSGSLAQTIWGLGYGDRLVGRDISTVLPGTEDLPVVTGSGHSISPEAVLELAPDLIVTDGTVGPIDVLVQLRQAGITVVFVREPAGLGQPAAQSHRVAEILGVPERGAQLAELINNQIDAVRQTITAKISDDPGQRLRMVFLYLRGASGIYYLFGEESGAGDLIEALGGIDVAGEIGWTGLRPVTDEALIEANPDLILVMTGGLSSVGGVDQLLVDKPAIALTTAGKNRRIVDMADNEVLGFGPRTPLVLDALARAIYAPDQ